MEINVTRYNFLRIPLILLLVLSFAGCATHREEIRLNKLSTKLFHRGRTKELPLPDMSSLRGRRICIDPGHGDPWPGAVSKSNRLRESDVNLRVSLSLRDLLEGSGAEVFLTREDDSALVPVSLSKDLEARIRIAHENNADVFISVHHNADIKKRSRKNDLEVYYNLNDDGASLDLAQCLTYELSQRVRRKAKAKRLLPGNYKVLRIAKIPAVLIESSYLSNRRNARNLSKPRTIESEARSIAAGLATYFSLDPPRVEKTSVIELDHGRTHQVKWQLESGYPIDDGSIEVLLDGSFSNGEVLAVDSDFMWTFADPLLNGTHTVILRAHNYQGASLTHNFSFVVDRPASSIHINQTPETVLRDSGCEMLLEVLLTDSFGFPVMDSTEVTLEEIESTKKTVGGLTRFYLEPDQIEDKLSFHSGVLDKTYSIVYGENAYKSIQVYDVRNNKPVSDVLLFCDNAVFGTSTADGWFSVRDDVATLTLARKGYLDTTVFLKNGHSDINIDPVELGILHGRRIAIDAAHGGRNPGLAGTGGTRASDLNLYIAKRVASYLSEAGAKPVLIRRRDEEVTNAKRIGPSQDVDIFVSISFGMPAREARLLDRSGHSLHMEEQFVAHYPGSKNGILLAKSIAEKLDIDYVVPAVSYVIQQTGCPAVLVHPASVMNVDKEDYYRSTERRVDISHGIYSGILEYYKKLDIR